MLKALSSTSTQVLVPCQHTHAIPTCTYMYLMSTADNFMHDYLYNTHVNVHVHLHVDGSCDRMIVHLYMQQSTCTCIYIHPFLHTFTVVHLCIVLNDRVV